MSKLMQNIHYKDYGASEVEQKGAGGRPNSPPKSPKAQNRSEQRVDATAKIPKEELEILDDFLDKFVFISDGMSSKEQIDLRDLKQ